MRVRLLVVGSAIAALGCGSARPPRHSTGTSANDSWEQMIRPLVARDCVPCHLKEGEAGLDLTSSAAWRRHRADVRRCVVIDKTMPPDGHPISDADREMLRAWIDANE